MSSFFRNSGSAGFLPKHMIAGAIHGGGGGRKRSWGSLGWLADEGRERESRVTLLCTSWVRM